MDSIQLLPIDQRQFLLTSVALRVIWFAAKVGIRLGDGDIIIA